MAFYIARLPRLLLIVIVTAISLLHVVTHAIPSNPHHDLPITTTSPYNATTPSSTTNTISLNATPFPTADSPKTIVTSSFEVFYSTTESLLDNNDELVISFRPTFTSKKKESFDPHLLCLKVAHVEIINYSTHRQIETRSITFPEKCDKTLTFVLTNIKYHGNNNDIFELLPNNSNLHNGDESVDILFLFTMKMIINSEFNDPNNAQIYLRSDYHQNFGHEDLSDTIQLNLHPIMPIRTPEQSINRILYSNYSIIETQNHQFSKYSQNLTFDDSLAQVSYHYEIYNPTIETYISTSTVSVTALKLTIVGTFDLLDNQNITCHLNSYLMDASLRPPDARNDANIAIFDITFPPNSVTDDHSPYYIERYTDLLIKCILPLKLIFQSQDAAPLYLNTRPDPNGLMLLPPTNLPLPYIMSFTFYNNYQRIQTARRRDHLYETYAAAMESLSSKYDLSISWPNRTMVLGSNDDDDDLDKLDESSMEALLRMTDPPDTNHTLFTADLSRIFVMIISSFQLSHTYIAPLNPVFLEQQISLQYLNTFESLKIASKDMLKNNNPGQHYLNTYTYMFKITGNIKLLNTTVMDLEFQNIRGDILAGYYNFVGYYDDNDNNDDTDLSNHIKYYYDHITETNIHNFDQIELASGEFFEPTLDIFNKKRNTHKNNIQFKQVTPRLLPLDFNGKSPEYYPPPKWIMLYITFQTITSSSSNHSPYFPSTLSFYFKQPYYPALTNFVVHKNDRINLDTVKKSLNVFTNFLSKNPRDILKKRKSMEDFSDFTVSQKTNENLMSSFLTEIQRSFFRDESLRAKLRQLKIDQNIKNYRQFNRLETTLNTTVIGKGFDMDENKHIIPFEHYNNFESNPFTHQFLNELNPTQLSAVKNHFFSGSNNDDKMNPLMFTDYAIITFVIPQQQQQIISNTNQLIVTPTLLSVNSSSIMNYIELYRKFVENKENFGQSSGSVWGSTLQDMILENGGTGVEQGDIMTTQGVINTAPVVYTRFYSFNVTINHLTKPIPYIHLFLPSFHYSFFGDLNYCSIYTRDSKHNETLVFNGYEHHHENSLGSPPVLPDNDNLPPIGNTSLISSKSLYLPFPLVPHQDYVIFCSRNVTLRSMEYTPQRELYNDNIPIILTSSEVVPNSYFRDVMGTMADIRYKYFVAGVTISFNDYLRDLQGTALLIFVGAAAVVALVLCLVFCVILPYYAHRKRVNRIKNLPQLITSLLSGSDEVHQQKPRSNDEQVITSRNDLKEFDLTRSTLLQSILLHPTELEDVKSGVSGDYTIPEFVSRIPTTESQNAAVFEPIQTPISPKPHPQKQLTELDLLEESKYNGASPTISAREPDPIQFPSSPQLPPKEQ